MRKIKFRAWDKLTGQWVEFNKPPRVVTGKSSSKVLVIAGSDDNVVFQQFTGLLDKNGKEIFEGDILSMAAHYPADHQKQVERHKHGYVFSKPVEFFEGCYWVGGENKDLEIVSKGGYFEVIGNIYENAH